MANVYSDDSEPLEPLHITMWSEQYAVNLAVLGHPLANDPDIIKEIARKYELAWDAECREAGNRILRRLEMELHRLSDPREAILLKLKRK